MKEGVDRRIITVCWVRDCAKSDEKELSNGWVSRESVTTALCHYFGDYQRRAVVDTMSQFVLVFGESFAE